MVLMRSCTPSSPRANIFLGVSAALNRARVALLTPASVACADSTTATSNVKGLTYSSSPLGSGLAAATRSGDTLALALRGRVRLSGRGAGPGRTVLGIGASRGPITLIGSQS